MNILDEGAIVAITLGLVQAAKTAGLPAKFAPLVSIALGIVGSFILSPTLEGVLKGVILGLSASGLYSGTKATIS